MDPIIERVLCKNTLYYDMSFWEVWYAKHCFVCHLERKNVKLIASIPEKKMVVTRGLSKGVTKLTIAIVLQRDHRIIKRRVTTNYQRHKKRVQPQLWDVKRSLIEVNSSTSCENPTSFNFLITQNYNWRLVAKRRENSHRPEIQDKAIS